MYVYYAHYFLLISLSCLMILLWLHMKHILCNLVMLIVNGLIWFFGSLSYSVQFAVCFDNFINVEYIRFVICIVIIINTFALVMYKKIVDRQKICLSDK